MGYTNIVLRIAQPSHPMHAEAAKSVRALLHRKEALHVAPQVAYEFWVAATRPVANNGLGLSIEQTKRLVRRAEAFFMFVPDVPTIFQEWLRLVETYSVSGVNAHDARLVAAMKIHGLTHLLTFNSTDFKRYHGVEITVVTPAEILHAQAASS